MNARKILGKKPQESDGFGDQCMGGRIKLQFMFWN